MFEKSIIEELVNNYNKKYNETFCYKINDKDRFIFHIFLNNRKDFNIDIEVSKDILGHYNYKIRIIHYYNNYNNYNNKIQVNRYQNTSIENVFDKTFELLLDIKNETIKQ